MLDQVDMTNKIIVFTIIQQKRQLEKRFQLLKQI